MSTVSLPFGCERRATPVSAQSGHRKISVQCSETLIAAASADRAKLPLLDRIELNDFGRLALHQIRVFDSHLARARRMTEHGYRQLLRGGASA
jgi:hypothetical protein